VKQHTFPTFSPSRAVKKFPRRVDEIFFKNALGWNFSLSPPLLLTFPVHGLNTIAAGAPQIFLFSKYYLITSMFQVHLIT